MLVNVSTHIVIACLMLVLWPDVCMLVRRVEPICTICRYALLQLPLTPYGNAYIILHRCLLGPHRKSKTSPVDWKL